MAAELTTLLRLMLLNQCGLDPRSSYQNDYGLQNGEEFDFIVVGGGSAGSVVASRLSEHENFNVLLVEAGDYPTAEIEIPSYHGNLMWNEKYDWMYETEPSKYNCRGFEGGRCRWPRGKVLGGSSSVNGMIYLQGLKSDFDGWKNLGNDGWGWNDIRRYIEISKIKTSHQPSWNKMRDILLSSGKDAGYPMPKGEGEFGIFEAPQNIYNGRRLNVAKAYLTNLSDRKNLKIAVNTLATKIIFENNTAVGVEVLYENNKLQVFARREVVVSAGSVNSPQLLMLSGVGPKKHLEDLGIDVLADLPVGKNLQDHFWMHGIFVGLNPIPNNTIGECYANALYCTEKKGPLATTDILNVCWFFRTNNKTQHPNVEIQHYHLPINDTSRNKLLLSTDGINSNTIDQVIEASKQYEILNFLPALLYPKSRGEILLRSKDPLAKPLIYPNYLTQHADLETMLASIETIRNLLTTPTMKKLNATFLEIKPPNCANLTFDTRDFWECNFRNLGATVYHPVGTCKMGSDATAVVDSTLKVRNVENLRVIDASVMPKNVGRNTNAACVTIGEKGADLITQDWITEFTTPEAGIPDFTTEVECVTCQK